ncbi:efflux RND transporter periplasmic adaptor subunit [Melaminivora jejuensis]|uniref:efflux RND transporter periplasmic adaptor subunit n=1 Tax=Melaminivora jejuensis TaxID=1267217 RepID=UPI001ADFE6F5|nr:efflux RND transporter periplasmic adaptor subunit [Melaminivora jejuensis]UHJ63799.1 efflux RND transporter periplasmic adaptor subunit [Melaminivora jejuensis]
MAVSADSADSPEHPAPAAFPAARRPRRWRAVLVALALIALLAALSWYLVQRARAPAGPGGAPGSGVPGVGMVFGGAMPASTVGAARAVQGELPIVIDALGTVTPSVTAALVPQVSGVLTEVLFEEGQSVRKGQVLARIDPRPFEQALAQAKSQSARDQAQLSAARVTLARYEELWRQDSIARQTLDTQTALVQQLEAALQADRASEGTARLNLEHTTLRAPVSGTIGLRAVDVGNLVSSGLSGGIATITQVQPIDVLFAVPQDRVPAVLAAQQAAAGGLSVVALDRARTQTLAEGRFLTLDNQVTASTGTVRAKARFANGDGALFPNQFVNARLQLGVERGVLVPVTALRSGPQGDYVYVIDDERTARLRPVVRGMASVREVLITQGLAAGERVVTEGGDRVKDGGKVQLAGEGGAPGGRGGARTPGAGAPAPAPAAPAASASASR